MKLETYLNAYDKAKLKLMQGHRGYYVQSNRRARQRGAFRDRILFMFENREIAIKLLQQRLREKDAAIDEAYLQIAQLMELARIVDRLRKHRMNSDYLIVLDLAPKILKEWDK